MKQIKTISTYLATAILILFLGSCDDTSDEFIISEPDTFVLNNLSVSSVELDPVNLSNPALTLSWTPADYGLQSSVNYSVEFSSDDVFTNPVVGGSITGNNTLTFSTDELNTAVGNAGLPAFNWNTVYVRVVSSLGTQNGSPVNSNTISLNVYPFFNYVFDDYYLVGDGTAPNWDNNNNNPPIFRNPDNSSEFNYTGYFTVGFFKLLSTKGLWQPQWGTNDGSTVEANLGSGSDPERFPTAGGAGITSAGNYSFTINFSTNTFTFEPYSGAAVANPTSMMIDGSGIASATAMNQLSFDSNMWYANSVRLTPGDLQFMADGSSAWGSTTAFSGTATAGGGSIPVEVEDDYDVWFNALTGQYILIPLNL